MAPTAPNFADAELSERARAKVNLTLRVVGRRADLYHELVSLVAFAGAGDRLSLVPGAGFALEVDGPRAAAAGPAADNLVLRAAEELARRVPGLRCGRFRLTKRLPVAAGLGGGSADAAAALRLLARANGMAPGDPRITAAALAAGSDVPACLAGRACLMGGRGERIEPVALPRFGAALVNPGVPVATAAVFARLGLEPGAALAGPEPLSADAVGAAAAAGRGRLVELLAGQPNDLEAAARRVAPILSEVAAALAATPEARLVRMSGSGATMFALYNDCRAAGRAAKMLAVRRPDWWVKPTVLG